jgi:hypothetical protein
LKRTADFTNEPDVVGPEPFLHVGMKARPKRRIRPQKVARAKELITDPSYPPRAVLRKVAERLVREIKSGRLLLFLHL